MMGTSHAVTGAAAWLAITATAAPSLELVQLDQATILLGTFVVAGAALAPDWDHPSATVARSLPGGSLLASGISAFAGGHRKGLHALLAVIVILPLTLLANTFTWRLNGWPEALPILTLALAAGCFAIALKSLRMSRDWVTAWIAALILTVSIGTLAPGLYALLPVCIALGYLVHILGDMLTVGGVPLLWPFMPQPPAVIRDSPVLKHIWLPGGHFAVPLIGTTGSWREWILTAALSAYVAWALFTTTSTAGTQLIQQLS